MTSEIKFLCPYCSQKLATPFSMGGMNIHCPVCQNAISVPIIMLRKATGPQLMPLRNKMPLSAAVHALLAS